MSHSTDESESESGKDNSMNEIKIISFEYKYGPPKTVDLAIFIKNWDSSQVEIPLKINGALSCWEFRLNSYNQIISAEGSNNFEAQVLDYIKANSQDKSQLVIALGCEGGKHLAFEVVTDLKRRVHYIMGIATSHKPTGNRVTVRLQSRIIAQQKQDLKKQYDIKRQTKMLHCQSDQI